MNVNKVANKTSVIITCHNYGDFLEESINSVLRQTMPAKEIIVVNDASSDNTDEIAKKIGDKIRYFFVDFKNAQEARNFGRQKASGEYIVFLDADDYFREDFIEKMQNEMELNPELMLVYSDRSNFGDKSIISALGMDAEWKTKEFDYNELKKGNYISLPALIRGSEHIYFDKNINRFQDWDLWLSLLKGGNAKRVPEALFFVRFHGKNKTVKIDGDIEKMKVMSKHGLLEGIMVSIILPTYNGEEFLEEVLTAIFNQQTNFNFEVIVIDSGSMDRTLEIVNRHPVRLIQIPNSEFGHGKTRNLGAEQANGEYLVYITQDATPASEKWLQSIITPFLIDNGIGNVLGKQIPREKCNPTTKRNIEETFKMIGGGKDEFTVYYIEDSVDGRAKYEANKEIMRFNSDVNAAYSKMAWEAVKFKEVSYAEDQVIGQDLLEAGYRRAYAPEAAVLHSHNYPIGDFLKRFFDEYKGLNDVFGFVDKNAKNPLRIIPGTFYGWFYDSMYIFKQKDYNLMNKIKWSWNSFMMNLFRRLGAYFGGKHKSLPIWLKYFLSLEQSNKNKRI